MLKAWAQSVVLLGDVGSFRSRQARKKLGHWGVALEGDLGTLVCLSIPVSGHHGLKQFCPTTCSHYDILLHPRPTAMSQPITF